MGRLRIIELVGSPAAMGEAFGEELRDDVRTLTESRIEHLVRFVEKHAPERRITRQRALEAVGRTVEAHRRFLPTVWDEFRGIARSAGLKDTELLVGNGLTDLRDFVAFECRAARENLAGHDGECSALLAPAKCADGRPIVGQTWDMNADAAPFVLVVRRKPVDAPETLCLTTAGCLCLIGMNAEGVAVGNTNLIPTDARVGVNYLFVITRALMCRSAREAADAIEAAPRLSGHNYYAADGSDVIHIEATARQSHRTVADRDVIVHTNHYLAEPLRPLEFTGQNLANSRWRYETLAEDAARLPLPISMVACWELLSHVSQDKVPPDISSGGTVATLATIVQCPAERRLLVCAGSPIAANAEEFSF